MANRINRCCHKREDPKGDEDRRLGFSAGEFRSVRRLADRVERFFFSAATRVYVQDWLTSVACGGKFGWGTNHALDVRETSVGTNAV